MITEHRRAQNRDAMRRYRERNRERVREMDRARRAANPEKAREGCRKWRRLHPERQAAADRAWAQSNPEAARARAMRWVNNNRERVRVKNRARKIKRRATTAVALMKAQRGRCAYCRCQLVRGETHIDHIIPRALDGANDRTNLQLTCKSCNHRKGAMHPISYAQSIGRLL